MKNIIWIAIILFGFSSCKKWLDVNPVSQVPEADLFKTQEGFEEALNGVYTSCAGLNLYGYQLTVGFPEVLAQNYSLTGEDRFFIAQTARYNYKDPNFIARKDLVWSGLYHAIANCNLILKNLETNGDVLSAQRHALIKAEALALRGFLHFDLLRLFAPSFKNGAGAKAIPYVIDFSNKVTPISNVTEVLTKIVTDLEEAKQLIKPVDPILDVNYVPSYPNNPEDKNPAEQRSGDLFLQNRRHRLNYYAICGELARVNLYLEKKNEALNNALEVINAKKFPWVETKYFSHNDPKLKDRILYKELLFGWYAPNAKDTLASRFTANNTSFVIEKNAGDALYESVGSGGEDIRPKEWLYLVSGVGTFNYYQVMKYRQEFERNLHYQIMPGIRLSEMYYIASECAYDANPTDAVGYLNMVRHNRGYNKLVIANDKETLLRELVKEARKEFYAEGQIFYMYKRLNWEIPGLLGGSTPASDKVFVMPLPDNELEFANRN